MLHCLNSSGNLAGASSEMTVLERQRERMKWQQEQNEQNRSYFCGTGLDGEFSSLQVQNSQGLMMMSGGGGEYSLSEVVATPSMKADPGSENGWHELGRPEMAHMGFVSSGMVPGFDANPAISRTSSCPPAVAAAAAPTSFAVAKGKESVVSGSAMEKTRLASGRESCKKRKSDKAQNPKVVAENDTNNKKMKGNAEEGESKITEPTGIKTNTTTTNNNDRETSADSSKDKSKASEVQKPDYIHVRARRGQATDSHSLAERVRRERISERMKYLQDLVPGCNKITGKAGMLEEIINYVQSLQQQVEFLSMKLAAANPRLDFNIDDLFTKEVFSACAPSFPTMAMQPDMANPSYLQFDSAQHVASCCGLDMGTNPPDMMLRKTISAPKSMPPETFLDSSCFPQILPTPTWEADLQNLYNVAFDQARSTTSFPSQPFPGLIEASNLKMEM